MRRRVAGAKPRMRVFPLGLDVTVIGSLFFQGPGWRGLISGSLPHKVRPLPLHFPLLGCLFPDHSIDKWLYLVLGSKSPIKVRPLLSALCGTPHLLPTVGSLPSEKVLLSSKYTCCHHPTCVFVYLRIWSFILLAYNLLPMKAEILVHLVHWDSLELRLVPGT